MPKVSCHADSQCVRQELASQLGQMSPPFHLYTYIAQEGDDRV